MKTNKNKKAQAKVKETIEKVENLKKKKTTAEVDEGGPAEVTVEEKAVKPKKKTTGKTKLAKTAKASPKEEVVSKVKKNAKNNLIEEVVSKREVTYIYPEGCDNPLDKKKFRQETRNKLKKMEAELFAIKDKTSKEFIKKDREYNKFLKSVKKAM